MGIGLRYERDGGPLGYIGMTGGDGFSPRRSPESADASGSSNDDAKPDCDGSDEPEMKDSLIDEPDALTSICLRTSIFVAGTS